MFFPEWSIPAAPPIPLCFFSISHRLGVGGSRGPKLLLVLLRVLPPLPPYLPRVRLILSYPLSGWTPRTFRWWKRSLWGDLLAYFLACNHALESKQATIRIEFETR
jgi:hypothetical protein